MKRTTPLSTGEGDDGKQDAHREEGKQEESAWCA